jgi:hypothetical protein
MSLVYQKGHVVGLMIRDLKEILHITVTRSVTMFPTEQTSQEEL